jgi:hypothetical protein
MRPLTCSCVQRQFCFESDSWARCINECCFLSKVFRQVSAQRAQQILATTAHLTLINFLFFFDVQRSHTALPPPPLPCLQSDGEFVDLLAKIRAGSCPQDKLSQLLKVGTGRE